MFQNNSGPFKRRPVIFSVASIKRKQNTRRGQMCKECSRDVIYKQSREMVMCLQFYEES